MKLTLILLLALCACGKRDTRTAVVIDEEHFVCVEHVGNVYRGCVPANDPKPGQILVADPEFVSAWNTHRSGVSCFYMDMTAQKQYSVVCTKTIDEPDYQDRPSRIPVGYRLVFYTSAPLGKPTGWVLVKGDKCQPKDLNCSD